jgi:Icc-related predicted phosphoesterase
LIAGLGGSPWYNGGDNQYTERRMFLRALRLLPRLLWNRVAYGRYLDVLVTHAAPFGVQDGSDRAHLGFKTFLWLMKRFRPRYLVHGHVHLWDRNQQRVSRYGDTTVVNAYDHVVLNLDEEPDVRP